jgi:ribosomal protein S27AE
MPTYAEMTLEQRVQKQQRNREWAARNPEKKKAARNRCAARYRAKYPERIWASQKRSVYGVTDAFLATKPERCPFCGSSKKICVDHDHKTGLVRGWICGECNLILGHAKDNSELLRKLADYLDQNAMERTFRRAA